MSKCRICERETQVVFNIDFKATPVCESCATRITVQQVHWWAHEQGEQEPEEDR